MPTITATEFQKSVGTYSDAAMREPVVITNHNRERLVLLSAQDYRRLEALDRRRVYAAADMPDDILEALKDEIAGYTGEVEDYPVTKF